MSQKRLSELEILSIEKNMLEKIDYKSFINNLHLKEQEKCNSSKNKIIDMNLI